MYMRGFEMGFQFFQLLFLLMFLMVAGLILSTVIREIGAKHKNDQSPRLTVNARIVAKRGDMNRRRGANDHYHTYTSYYVTFEVESGDRMELQLQGHEYGLLVEGDTGKLTFQGTRYLGFKRL